MNGVVRELRPRGRPRSAFVLGGGGNLGAVQVGMLRALVERGHRPDFVVGTSVGAVNGAAFAVDPTSAGIAWLRETWFDPTSWSVFGGRFAPWQLFRKATSMVGDEKLRALLGTRLGDRHLDTLGVPVHVVATSLRTGRERWFSSGPAVPAVLASAALPAVLPPVEIDGDLLIDGAVVDNVPVGRAIALGATRVFVLHVGNVARPRPVPKRPIDVLLTAFSIARNHRFEAERDELAGQVELVVLPGIDPGPLRRNDFSRAAELERRGHDAAADHLDRLAPAASS